MTFSDFSTPAGPRRVPLLVPDSSLVKDGKPVFLPHEERRYELRPTALLRLCRTGKKIAPRFVHRYVDAVGAGALLVDTAAWDECRRLGLPFAPACLFDGAAVRGALLTPPDGEEDGIAGMADAFAFTFSAGGAACRWSMAADAPDWRERLSLLSELFTFKTGDLAFLSLGEGLTVVPDTHITARRAETDTPILEYNIK